MPANTAFRTPHSASVLLRLTALAAACLLASACAVGPNFKTPEAPKVTGYTPQPLPEQTSSAATQGGEAQRFVSGMQVSDQWWKTFQSDKLNKVIADAFAASPTLAAAQAALRVAQQQTRAQQASFFPLLQGSYQPSRQQNAVGTISPTLTSGAPIYTLHTAQLTISYAPDVFGLTRRQVESLKAAEDAQYFQMEAAYLTLASNIVAAAVQEASLRAQIAAQQRIVDINNQLVDNLRKQFQFGAVTGLDVAAAVTALAQAEQALPNLQKQLAVQRDLLAALAGRLPSEGIPETFTFADFKLPQDLPVSLPSDLVRQRPDVRAAEEQLHAATAQVGVAIANMLPQLTITGTKGGTAEIFSQMFRDGNVFWSLVGNVAQTFFDGGALLAKKRGADAGVDQAEAQYRGTVITAFQNVADTLHALDADADVLKAALKSEQAAQTTLNITDKQRALGQVNILAVLNAEQAYQTATQATIAARANRFTDTAALFQALGGGWWNRDGVSTAKN
ncbi:efflux transporter, outer membrane factor (OMF) lipo, NodT family protein [Ralstonia insidiosa]|uniref:Efflux transporter, outer membrane factor (OMF) lipo, NodT family protein n=1 Tax=Ralstonia insidiosa TaxID=190721 RepID=A0AAC9BL46_9RALS|nr:MULTISPECIES: efflux transporter outer membrane subunit [Ralstonia]ANH76153.1 efflux transporter, outer membrane factor (OMF) lipo, NodT family protein [Ralstonia insidiosa]EPY00090.1 RND transporter [Ralstonia sp. AU12-08]MBY4705710.1 efflux transporter outer membrane subunit [Ralstonia insidiosa]GAQ29941.1 RND efflux system, outer membrane lipoprotein, NodT family [Ralstonia sp. NT80]